jgi:hypothetical protein
MIVAGDLRHSDWSRAERRNLANDVFLDPGQDYDALARPLRYVPLRVTPVDVT